MVNVYGSPIPSNDGEGGPAPAPINNPYPSGSAAAAQYENDRYRNTPIQGNPFPVGSSSWFQYEQSARENQARSTTVANPGMANRANPNQAAAINYMNRPDIYTPTDKAQLGLMAQGMTASQAAEKLRVDAFNRGNIGEARRYENLRMQAWTTETGKSGAYHYWAKGTGIPQAANPYEYGADLLTYAEKGYPYRRDASGNPLMDVSGNPVVNPNTRFSPVDYTQLGLPGGKGGQYYMGKTQNYDLRGAMDVAAKAQREGTMGPYGNLRSYSKGYGDLSLSDQQAIGRYVNKSPYQNLGESPTQESTWDYADNRGKFVPSMEPGVRVNAPTQVLSTGVTMNGKQYYKPFVSASVSTEMTYQESDITQGLKKIPVARALSGLSEAIFPGKYIITRTGQPRTEEKASWMSEMAGGKQDFTFKLSPGRSAELAVGGLATAQAVKSRGTDVPVGEPIYGERYPVGASVVTTRVNPITGDTETVSSQAYAQDVTQKRISYDLSRSNETITPVNVMEVSGRKGMSQSQILANIETQRQAAIPKDEVIPLVQIKAGAQGTRDWAGIPGLTVNPASAIAETLKGTKLLKKGDIGGAYSQYERGISSYSTAVIMPSAKKYSTDITIGAPDSTASVIASGAAGIGKQIYTDIRENPVQDIALYGAGSAFRFGKVGISNTVARMATSDSRILSATGRILSTPGAGRAGKYIEYGIGGMYAVSAGSSIVLAPNAKAREVAIGDVVYQVGTMGVGAYMTRGYNPVARENPYLNQPYTSQYKVALGKGETTGRLDYYVNQPAKSAYQTRLVEPVRNLKTDYTAFVTDHTQHNAIDPSLSTKPGVRDYISYKIGEKAAGIRSGIESIPGRASELKTSGEMKLWSAKKGVSNAVGKVSNKISGFKHRYFEPPSLGEIADTRPYRPPKLDHEPIPSGGIKPSRSSFYQSNIESLNKGMGRLRTSGSGRPTMAQEQVRVRSDISSGSADMGMERVYGDPNVKWQMIRPMEVRPAEIKVEPKLGATGKTSSAVKLWDAREAAKKANEPEYYWGQKLGSGKATTYRYAGQEVEGYVGNKGVKGKWAFEAAIKKSREFDAKRTGMVGMEKTDLYRLGNNKGGSGYGGITGKGGQPTSDAKMQQNKQSRYSGGARIGGGGSAMLQGQSLEPETMMDAMGTSAKARARMRIYSQQDYGHEIVRLPPGTRRPMASDQGLFSGMMTDSAAKSESKLGLSPLLGSRQKVGTISRLAQSQIMQAGQRSRQSTRQTTDQSLKTLVMPISITGLRVAQVPAQSLITVQNQRQDQIQLQTQRQDQIQRQTQRTTTVTTTRRIPRIDYTYTNEPVVRRTETPFPGIMLPGLSGGGMGYGQRVGRGRRLTQLFTVDFGQMTGNLFGGSEPRVRRVRKMKRLKL